MLIICIFINYKINITKNKANDLLYIEFNNWKFRINFKKKGKTKNKALPSPKKRKDTL